ncbi:hypothetical protein H9P43_009094 [Blastocladiella emersonii ATCC 22665]|nr:hypothetical protein H9P43_009094 [Blastocladiella emersonii ATCC 22665]
MGTGGGGRRGGSPFKSVRTPTPAATGFTRTASPEPIHPHHIRRHTAPAPAPGPPVSTTEDEYDDTSDAYTDDAEAGDLDSHDDDESICTDPGLLTPRQRRLPPQLRISTAATLRGSRRRMASPARSLPYGRMGLPHSPRKYHLVASHLPRPHLMMHHARAVSHDDLDARAIKAAEFGGLSVDEDEGDDAEEGEEEEMQRLDGGDEGAGEEDVELDTLSIASMPRLHSGAPSRRGSGSGSGSNASHRHAATGPHSLGAAATAGYDSSSSTSSVRTEIHTGGAGSASASASGGGRTPATRAARTPTAASFHADTATEYSRSSMHLYRGEFDADADAAYPGVDGDGDAGSLYSPVYAEFGGRRHRRPDSVYGSDEGDEDDDEEDVTTPTPVHDWSRRPEPAPTTSAASSATSTLRSISASLRRALYRSNNEVSTATAAKDAVANMV